jgi:hypothetical protein
MTDAVFYRVQRADGAVVTGNYIGLGWVPQIWSPDKDAARIYSDKAGAERLMSFASKTTEQDVSVVQVGAEKAGS